MPEGCPNSDERSDTWSNWDDAIWTDAWRYTWVGTWEKAPTRVTSINISINQGDVYNGRT